MNKRIKAELGLELSSRLILWFALVTQPLLLETFQMMTYFVVKSHKSLKIILFKIFLLNSKDNKH